MGPISSDSVTQPGSAVTTHPAVAAPEPGTTVTPRLRAALRGIPRYVPGRPVAPPPGLTAYKISSNENPYPPLPAVLAAAAEAATRMNRYPDLTSGRLIAALAERLDVPPEDLVVGPGSVALLGQLVTCTAAEGDEVVYAWRSFESFPIVTQCMGATSVRVPLTADGRHDLDAMAAAVTERTRLLLICSPNNPTGPAVRADELDRLLDRVPPDLLVVVDEAYREFVRDPAVADGLAYYRRRPNVAVLRTFSKAYGLAGLRVGYAIAREPVADALRATSIPFAVSQPAQDAAVASLGPEAEAELLERVEALAGERDRVIRTLRAQGWQLPDSQANFVWLPLGPATERFTETCAAAGLAVRPFPGEGARCTVAEPAANDRFLEVCERFLAGDGSPVRVAGAPSM